MNENAAVNSDELEAFRVLLECNLNDHLENSFDNLAKIFKRVVEVMPGMKYHRVVVGDRLVVDTHSGKAGDIVNRSAYCFIDGRDGSIYKCAGWKAPAKGIRGNIRNGGPENWWSGALGPYGAAHMVRVRHAKLKAAQEDVYNKAYEAAQAGGMNNTDSNELAMEQACRRCGW